MLYLNVLYIYIYAFIYYIYGYYSFLSYVDLYISYIDVGFPGGALIKNPPAKQETQESQVWSLGHENPLE